MEDERIKYDDLTDEQKSAITNGCGNKKFLVKPPDYIFEEFCKKHDFRYYRGKGPSITSWRFWMSPFRYLAEKRRDRLEADVLFYSEMINCVNETFEHLPLKHEEYSIIANRFFKAVRLFGWFFYNWFKEKDMKDLEKDISEKE